MTQLRLAFLTNMVPPYHKPLLRLLTERYSLFRIFISTPMEANRPWIADWSGLDVVVQKGMRLNRRWLHPGGFGEAVTIHFPLDTVSQLSRFRPDVIMSGEMGMRTLLALVYRKWKRRSRLMIWSEVTAATEQGRGWMRAILRKLLARNVDGFLALGTRGVEYIRSLGVPDRKIFKIAYTTDIEPFTSIAIDRQTGTEYRLLYAGQLISRKGLIPFLKTISKWAEANAERDVELVIVGNGPLFEDLKSLPVAENVKLMFRGALQYEELPSVYAEAGIFVLPTFADTWGVVVNEALASAMPVLGSLASQAVEEMVEDGKTGWTFRPQYEDEMYLAIDRALTCPLRDLRQMRVQARKRALEVSPAYVAHLVESAIDRCIQEVTA